MVIARTKVKAWLRCDHGGKTRGPGGQKRMHSTIRLQECPFIVTAKRLGNQDDWMLTVEDPSHNHTPTLPGSRPALRKLVLTEEIVDVIKRQSKIDIAPVKLITILRFDTDQKSFMFKPQNIYNAKAKIKRPALETFTFV